MFYYKITVLQKRQADASALKHHYRECLKPEHVGEVVANFLAKRGVQSVRVKKINQAAYVRATRRD